MARNLEVHMGLLHYCSFRLEAADDADTARRKDTSSRIYQN